MTHWLTAREIACACLPGLPRSKRRINNLATRQGWAQAVSAKGTPLARVRAGRDGGGGMEYHYSLLPAAAQATLVARSGRTAPAPRPAVSEAVAVSREVSVLDARAFLLARSDEFWRANCSLSRRHADRIFAMQYLTGAVQVPDWVREVAPNFSRATLARWREEARAVARGDDVAALRRRTSEISGLLDGEVAQFIGALIIKQPFLTAAHLRHMVDGRYGATLGSLPSERAFQRFASSWKAEHATALQKLTNPDAFKGASRIAGSNSNGHVQRLNQLWEIDASPADVLTTDGRWSVYVAIDVWSRRMMVFVSSTARTEATLLLIRRAVLAWGVPEMIRTDNGSDFTSHRFMRAINSLGVAHDITAPFSPEQKGTVERAIGTLQRGLMRVLPGFVGHSVADRKQIEGRKAFSQRLGEGDESTFQVSLTAAQLQGHCDEWCEGLYGTSPHRGLGGMTPFLKVQSYKGRIERIENPRALDLLLAPVAGKDGYRQVTKQGVRLEGGYFLTPDIMPGTRIYCRQDPEDMGQVFCFRDETGPYLATAVCPERAGIDPKEAVLAARARQKEILDAALKDQRSLARKIKPTDMVDWLHAGPKRRNATVTAFPTASNTYVTPALTAAGEATDESDEVLLQPISAATMPGLAASVVALPESPRQRFSRALALEAMVKAGDPVSTGDAVWLGGYQSSAEYRSQKIMLAEFGEAAVTAKQSGPG